MAVWRLACWQLRAHCAGPLLAALGWLAGLTLVFGTENLPPSETTRLLEGFGPACGVFLFIGLFAPEADRGLRDCVAVRRASYLFTCALRAAWLALAAALLAAGCTLALWLRGCAVRPVYAAAFFANALFLGALGLLGATLPGSVVAGAVPPLAWLLVDTLSGRLGAFSLLRYTTGSGMPKPWVLLAALALLGTAFGARYGQLKRG